MRRSRSARGMEQVIAVEVAGGGQRLDEGERRLRADHHGDRRCAVQGDDGGGLQALEHIVEPDDLRPVRVFGPRRLTMERRDRRLRSEEHTSELQSPCNLVCRLLLEKKKQYDNQETLMSAHHPRS